MTTEITNLVIGNKQIETVEINPIEFLSKLKVYKNTTKNQYIIQLDATTDVIVQAKNIGVFTSDSIVLKTVGGSLWLNPIMNDEGEPINVIKELDTIRDCTDMVYNSQVESSILAALGNKMKNSENFFKWAANVADDESKAYYTATVQGSLHTYNITIKCCISGNNPYHVEEAEFHIGDTLFFKAVASSALTCEVEG